MARSLVERELPVWLLSRDSSVEMSFKPEPAYFARCRELQLECRGGFYDPKVRNLHPWLARRSRSVARALNLAALLPPEVGVESFLRYLGFTRESLLDAVSRGYPPLISYLRPGVPQGAVPEGATVLDPMAGGGSIPLEAAVLGVRAVACDYNPVAYLVLRATLEFPARYGVELWRRLVLEARKLVEAVSGRLARYYREGVGGYIVLRQVKLGGEVVPLQSEVQLSRRLYARVEGGSVRLAGGKASGATRRELLRLWMEQHVKALEGDEELYGVTHRFIAVQEGGGFRVAGDGDVELAVRAYRDYLSSRGGLSVPEVAIPEGNAAFSELQPLGRFSALFSPRQALALDALVSYVRGRVAELSEEEGEFGAAVGLYLALGVSRVANFNSILSTWNHNTLTVRGGAGSYYRFRRFRLEGSYAEAVVPFRTLGAVFEPESRGRTAGGICPVVRELAEVLEGRGGLVEVYMCNALELSKHFKGVADVVNVDPPYYDWHVYSDFSELFWPVLKASLEPALHLLFGGRVLTGWSPSSWSVPREDEIVARRGDKASYEAKLERALREVREALKDSGLLVLWFNHRSLEAWEAVAKALCRAQFTVTSVIPLPSEHPARSVTRGGRAGLNRSLVIVARKREHAGEVDREEVLARFKRYLPEAKVTPAEEIPEEEAELLARAVERILSC